MPVDTDVGPVHPVIPEMVHSVQVDTLIKILMYMHYAHLFFPHRLDGFYILRWHMQTVVGQNCDNTPPCLVRHYEYRYGLCARQFSVSFKMN